MCGGLLVYQYLGFEVKVSILASSHSLRGLAIVGVTLNRKQCGLVFAA